MTTPDSLVETLAAQWDGCEYDTPGGLIDIGDAIRRAGLPLAAILRAEAERLAAQSAPTAAQVEPSARAAPGGCMTDAVEIPVEAVIERLSFLADNDEHGSAIARQTLKRAAELLDFYHIMALPEAGVDDELRSLGIDPDKAAERADRAIKGALAGAQVEPVRMLTEEEPEKCYSLDEENFHDFGDFMDMLDEDQCKPGLLVFEGESVRHTASHYACGAVADMFERMAEQAFDEAGEHIGDWPDHAVKGERLAELERLIFDWLDANVKVHFYTVKNVREIALTAEMIGDDAGIIPADGEVRPTQEQGQDAAPAEQPQDDEPTWQELEDFRKRHWTHWNAADNLLIAHLAQKLKCAARPAAQPGAQEPAK